ncbi:hypothetical protein BKA64DRAFT_42445 [Cadophora sp. MPI-SDFR-AT-0126]|nr:hypothetical protein BKA64DRAFT_42445 [Leotiomycetes sp. MPI-SDFR-AT-0126]
MAKMAQGWYLPSTNIPSSKLLEDAFAEAQLKFSSSMTKEQRKIDLVNSKSNLEELRTLVTQSMGEYENRKMGSKAGKWLHKFSLRIKFYGDILDVFVQHHPEYVALVWGAMKFLFTVGWSFLCRIIMIYLFIDLSLGRTQS